MALDRTHVMDVIDVYIRAWVGQDPDLIVTIFTEGATYHERVMEEPIRLRSGIQDYWRTKVLRDQANITCSLLSLYIDGDTAVAEWEAYFDDLPRGVRKRMREVAILSFEDGLIAGLREYWASEVVGSLGEQTTT